MTTENRPTRTLAHGAFAPIALGCALFDLGAAAQAGGIEGIRQVSPETARSTQDVLGRGKFLLRSGNVPLALEMYRQAMVQNPNSVEALNGAAVCYDRLGQFDVSRSYYEAALGIDPQSPMLLNNYGYSLFLQGNLADASRYLALAAASGDRDVQAASLRLLAKVEAARSKAAAGTARVAAVPADAGPSIVRTSSYEQRLVLQPPATATPPQMAVALGEDAVAVVAITRMSPAEERAIVVHEAQLVRAEGLAAAAAAEQDEAFAHARAEETVPGEMLSVLAAGTMFASVHSDDFLGFGPQATSDFPADEHLDWLAGYMLVPAPGAADRRRIVNRDGPLLAALPSGLLVQRSNARPPAPKVLPAAEPLAKKRSFEAPFQSDDVALNGFAAQLHGSADDAEGEIETKVALLQDLIERLRAA